MQVACLLMHDTVLNRMHWPRQAELKINHMVYRPYGRNGNTKLGNNARDEPANAAHRCVSGRNRVSLSCAEDRQFCKSLSSLDPPDFNRVYMCVSAVHACIWLVCAAVTQGVMPGL